MINRKAMKFLSLTILLFIPFVFLACESAVNNISSASSNSSLSMNSSTTSMSNSRTGNPVNSFEIPVTDIERAIDFYGKVFGYQFERETVDGNEMAWFPMVENASGASGSLAKGESYIPSKNGSRIYFSVDNIDATLSNANENGGKTLYPKTLVGELGWVAEFEDTEGNRIALHQK